MFIELVDSLRCPADHPPSTLVGAFDRLEDREVIDGMLGCPVCRSEFRIARGELWLVTNAMPSAPTKALNPEEDGLRLAASLDLRHENGFALLRGPWCALAAPISEVSPTHLVLLDPPLNLPRGPGRSVIHAGGTIPFAPKSAVAGTIDDNERAFAMGNAVRAGGRIVGPVNVAIPAGARELVRDDRWWVAEVEAVSEPVPLRRGTSRS